jgi:ribosomal protein S18 acetylase RimI-like enzyme
VGFIRPLIRSYDDRDADAVVDFSLRAWALVFASVEQTLGSEVFRRQHPDWREDQRRAVEEVCAAKKGQVWVAEVGTSTVGFVAVELDHPERSIGEISMVAVDPDYQCGGIGTALTEFALDRLKETGMEVAMVESGGDPEHAAARRTYEKAGYVLLPIARYCKNL